MVNKGLGKGFDSLLPTDFDTTILQDERDRIQRVLISDIKPNKDQPRRIFDNSEIEQLADSIRVHGIIQPLIIRKLEDGTMQIVAGERRWRAASIAGLKDVPAIVRSLEELTELELSLIENIQRVDLSPLEQAMSIHRLHHQFSLKFDEIAQRLGKAVSTVNNLARLTKLPEQAKSALQQKKITEGHARTILSLTNEDDQIHLLALITKNNWTVRQAEQYVLAQKSGKSAKASKAHSEQETTPQTRKLAKWLDTKVLVRRSAKGGAVVIQFKDDKHLETLLKKIQKLS